MSFEYILENNLSLLELLDADYTFLNDDLAEFYGIEGVDHGEMRKVDLPPDSHRGGILTQATILGVTSNPTRTSPVKRGLFILENILGTPAPPAPPDVPELEEAEKTFDENHAPSMRELMAAHREKTAVPLVPRTNGSPRIGSGEFQCYGNVAGPPSRNPYRSVRNAHNRRVFQGYPRLEADSCK